MPHTVIYSYNHQLSDHRHKNTPSPVPVEQGLSNPIISPYFHVATFFFSQSLTTLKTIPPNFTNNIRKADSYYHNLTSVCTLKPTRHCPPPPPDHFKMTTLPPPPPRHTVNQPSPPLRSLFFVFLLNHDDPPLLAFCYVLITPTFSRIFSVVAPGRVFAVLSLSVVPPLFLLSTGSMLLPFSSLTSFRAVSWSDGFFSH